MFDTFQEPVSALRIRWPLIGALACPSLAVLSLAGIFFVGCGQSINAPMSPSQLHAIYVWQGLSCFFGITWIVCFVWLIVVLLVNGYRGKV